LEEDATMTQIPAQHLPESTDPASHASSERERAWSFMAVAAVIVVGLSLLVGLALLLSRLLGNPPA
jgi:hypothetical protein